MKNKLEKMRIRQNFIYPEIKDSDRTYGATLTGKIVNPLGDWRQYLPPTEDQNVRGIESSACYVEAQQHAIATVQEEEFNLIDQNYSARFNALLSGGTTSGGDPIKAAKSIKYDGLVPDTLMPFGGDIQSWDDFHSWKGVEMNDCRKQAKVWLGQWSADFKIVAEKDDPIEVKYENLRQALKIGVPSISVANYRQKNGVYYKLQGERDIHFVEAVYVDSQNRVTIRDTYSPYEKILEPNYNFDFSLVSLVEKRVIVEKKIGIIQSLVFALLRLVGIMEEQGITELPKPIPTIPNPVPNPAKPTLLISWAKAIEKYEGANPAWCNPGAIRGKDGKFLKFKTYQEGFDYLCDYLKRAATGKHKAYPKGGITTLLEFQKIYSPAYDNNNPLKYAQFVAKELGISIDTHIVDLVV